MKPLRFQPIQRILAAGLWARIVVVVICSVILCASAFRLVHSEKQFEQSRAHISSFGLETVIIQSPTSSPAQQESLSPKTDDQRPGLSVEQLQELGGLIPNGVVTALSRELGGPSKFEAKGRTVEAALFGCDPKLFEVSHLQVDAGRPLAAQEKADVTIPCVISPEVAEKLFPYKDALGKSITMTSTKPYIMRVVGVLKRRPGAAPMTALLNDELSIFIPEPMFASAFDGQDSLKTVRNHIALKLADANRVADAVSSLHAGMDRMDLRSKAQVIAPKLILDQLTEARIRQRIMQVGIVTVTGLLTLLAVVFATYAEGPHEAGIAHASRGSRLRAAIFDGLITSVLGILIVTAYLTTPPLRSALLPFVNPTAALLAGLCSYWLIHGYPMTYYGQTWGKRLCNIVVVDSQTGIKVGLVRFVMRDLFKFVFGCAQLGFRYTPLALLDVLLIFSPSRRCVHDLVARTKVHKASTAKLSRMAEMLMGGWLLSISPLLAEPVVAQSDVEELSKEVAQLSESVIEPAERQTLANQLPEFISRLRQRFHQADLAAWAANHSRDDWQRFRDERLKLLRQSLGQPSSPPEPLLVEVTGRYEDPAQRFVVENIIYQSRRDVWVTANLYRPAKSITSAPGIIISHAHHTPKEHAELQAMGMTWAQAGCYVLVPDHFGHGERRQHPFVSAESFAGNFRVSRQDYYFRYDTGIKLHLLGESLMSWLAWDLSRAVDCVMQQPGIDKAKIILLGAVAGGGDPCAVAAALDQRIAAAVPFNFGGPQPETPYPLPGDAEASFNYSGSGSWESTRNLTNSAAAGFMPWMIVGSLAPRPLIYAHEFRWDRQRDPVWQRLQTIYRLYASSGNLAFTHGSGELRGQAPEATHCTHIGAVHRQLIHQAFRGWFQIDVEPDREILEPLPVEALHCLKDDAQARAKTMQVDFAAMAKKRVAAVRPALSKQSVVERRRQLQQLWAQILTPVEPPAAQAASPSAAGESAAAHMANDRRALTTVTLHAESARLKSEDDLQIPIVLLHSKQTGTSKKQPAVLVVQTRSLTQHLKQYSRELAQLLADGKAVCLCDVRGVGEGRSARGRTSSATALSSSLLMLGDPLIAAQLRDLRAVWRWLGTHPEIDAQQVQVWGDSRSTTVTAETDRIVPRDDDALLPPTCEPTACLLALLLSLYEDSVHSLQLSGGLSSFSSALAPTQIRLPHDCVLPGILRAGDIEELIVQAAERIPVRCESFVDGHNRIMSSAALTEYAAQLKQLCPSESRLQLSLMQK